MSTTEDRIAVNISWDDIDAVIALARERTGCPREGVSLLVAAIIDLMRRYGEPEPPRSALADAVSDLILNARHSDVSVN